MERITKPAIFFTKNFLNNNSEILVNGTRDNKKLLFDNEFINKPNFYTGNQAAIVIKFYDSNSVQLFHIIDTLILQNINFKNFSVSVYDINNNQKNLITEQSFDKNFLKLDFNSSKIDRIEITINDTQNNENIKFGQLRAVKKITELIGLTETNIDYVVDEGSLRTFDGSLTYWLNFKKWAASISSNHTNINIIDTLREIIYRDGFITVQPFPDFRPFECYEVMIPQKNINKYGVNRFSSLNNLTLELEAR